MAADNDIPRSVKLFQAFWPALLALLVSGASVAQTTSRVNDLDRRVEDISANGAPVTRERLARIEAKQDAMAEAMARMEQKLDDMDKRTRERNLNGL